MRCVGVDPLLLLTQPKDALTPRGRSSLSNSVLKLFPPLSFSAHLVFLKSIREYDALTLPEVSWLMLAVAS